MAVSMKKDNEVNIQFLQEKENQIQHLETQLLDIQQENTELGKKVRNLEHFSPQRKPKM